MIPCQSECWTILIILEHTAIFNDIKIHMMKKFGNLLNNNLHTINPSLSLIIQGLEPRLTAPRVGRVNMIGRNSQGVVLQGICKGVILAASNTNMIHEIQKYNN